MPWFTNKETGGKFNTDWFSDEYKQRYAQIHFNQSEASKLNEQEKEDDFTKQVNSIIGRSELSPNLSEEERAKLAQDRLNDCYFKNKINPNYNDPKYPYRDYHQNCALCTTAVALQAKGYDVEAQGRDFQWRGAPNIFSVDYSNPDNYMLSNAALHLTGLPRVRTAPSGAKYISYTKNIDNNNTINMYQYDPPITPRGAKAVSKAVIDKVRKWGPGAVGDLSIMWKSRNSAHSVAMINLGGKAFIYDSQDNSMYSEDQFERYFSNTTANTTSLVRLDNAEFNRNSQNFMTDLNKMAKRRNSK